MTNVPTMTARVCGGDQPRLHLGEGPVWDDATGRLLWVDITTGRVFEGILDGDDVSVTSETSFGEMVGAVAPTCDGGLIVAGVHDVRLSDRTGRVTRNIPVIEAGIASRLNDATCDPAGRFIVGGIRQDGRVADEWLVSIDAEGAVTQLASGISVSNGIGFSPDASTMYHVDSRPGSICAYDYDLATGRLGDRRTVWEGDAIPDGLAVDVVGNLWVAYFGDAQVRCMTPQGEVIAVVEVPVPNPTCPAFVGPARDRLLISTAREKMTAEQLQRWPDSGALFIADVGVAGLATTAWAGSALGETGRAGAAKEGEQP